MIYNERHSVPSFKWTSVRSISIIGTSRGVTKARLHFLARLAYII